ncbi:UPF0057-domain-containing protein [Lentithecium fluviatile CBS 122367]|uniref:UPF0057-domain-containing protein n=1 Tax=Lentithecium fluviatile CBS 122367 TaxID=1168545 RepID=A0A6G1IW17_9PLEO|nr:UPF0057-domain-containing protein [Lentithecium fluviatile CBS 122367]
MCGTDCFLMLLSVLFPPIGVWVKRGICSADSLINLALCCLGFLPGLIHAFYIILQYPDPYDYERVADHERGHHAHTTADGAVTYYYVSHGQPQHPAGQPNYGTVGSQPSGGQFPGQQSGFVRPQQGKSVQAQNGVAGQEVGAPGASGGEGTSEPSGPPPTYADVIKGDHKVQKP